MLTLVLGGVLGVAGLAFAFPKELHIAQEISQWLQPDEEVSISQKIQDGIALLKTSPPLEYSPGVRQQTALALLNTRTGEVSEERVWITPDGDVLESSIPVRIVWWNVFNSVYEIPNRPELVVVANKFLIERKYLPEQQTLKLALDAPTSKYTDMVYVPYSQQLHWPDVIDSGKSYIEEHVERAIQELRHNHVQSRAKPGMLVADVVPVDLIKHIVLVEHVDPNVLQFADDGGQALVERALVIIGANREWAYRYTSSSANAYGLAQFIEPTYDLMVERYPAAGLITDHTLGMSDHTNAFKAIALLFDNEAAEIQSKTTTSDVTREMIAAAYNGGPSRVIRAINSDGQNWADSAIFPSETREYIKKYRLLEALNIFE